MWRYLLLFSNVGLIIAQGATKILILPLEPIGVDEKTNYAISRTIKDAFVAVAKFEIIEPEGEIPGFSSAVVCSIGKTLGAEKAFWGSAIQLGEKYTISYRFIDISTAQVEFSDKISTTKLEEMDVIAERIVQAIIEKKPIEKTVEVGKVIETEVPQFKTREPFASLTFRAGYTTGFVPRMLTFETSLLYETKDILAEALLGGRGKGEAGEFFFDLLLHKITSTKDISTYYGGGLGIHHFEDYSVYDYYYHRSDDGLALNFSAGLLTFRTYYFRLMANVRASLAFTDEFGTIPSASLTFGLTTPSLDKFNTGKDLGGLGTCLGGCLGIYLISLMMGALF